MRTSFFVCFLNWNHLRESLLPLRANDVVISSAPNAPNPKPLTSSVSGKVDLFTWLLCELLVDWWALELVFYFLTRLVCTTELPKSKLGFNLLHLLCMVNANLFKRKNHNFSCFNNTNGILLGQWGLANCKQVERWASYCLLSHQNQIAS